MENKKVNIKDVTSEYLYNETLDIFEFKETVEMEGGWRLKEFRYKLAREVKTNITADDVGGLLDQLEENLKDDFLIPYDHFIDFTEENKIKLATVLNEIVDEAYGVLSYLEPEDIEVVGGENV